MDEQYKVYHMHLLFTCFFKLNPINLENNGLIYNININKNLYKDIYYNEIFRNLLTIKDNKILLTEMGILNINENNHIITIELLPNSKLFNFLSNKNYILKSKL